MTNPILAGDSYKLSHRAQLPANTTFMYSHLTPRFVKYLKQKFPTMDDKVIVYGLQATIAMVTERWEKEFFQRDWDDIEKETLHVLTPFLGYTAEHISHFKDLHTLGYLPLKFKTLPEGSHVEVNLPVLTVQNTHPDYPWLTNFVEPSLLNTVYKPMTVATLSLELAQLRDKEWDLTVSDHTLKPFALHDFSYRGQAGHESASATISAYLLYTKGTDTMSAIEFAQKYYQAGQDIAGSISAYEHSTATLNIQLYRNVLDHYDEAMEEDSSLTLDEIYSSSDLGVSRKAYLFGMEAALRVRDILLRNKDSKLNIELAVGETFALARHLIDVYPEGLFAYVSDSYNYHRLIGTILPELKEVITSRNGKLVIRPDSGNPVDVICGFGKPQEINGEGTVHELAFKAITEALKNNRKVLKINGNYYHVSNIHDEFTLKPINEVEAKGSIQKLWDIFGGTINDKGYQELDPHIGLVYGDGMNYERIATIYAILRRQGFAASNVVLSGGAYMLSNLTRDDLGFAIKASYAEVNGKGIAVYKAPATDPSKASKSGLFCVEKTEEGNYILHDNVTPEQEAQGELRTVWEDGKFVNRTTFDEIKARLPL